MATATGTWSSNITAGFIDLARKRSKESTKDDQCQASHVDLFTCLSENPGYADLCNEKYDEYQNCTDALTSFKRHHKYTFNVDDNGLHINGFILQTDKHKGKRQKFRVYLDSNENRRFDKNDQLIGRSGLKQKHAAKGVGNLLDEDEVGQLEVKFKKAKSNASMRDADEVDVQSIGGGVGIVMSFTDSDNAEIVSIKDTGLSYFVPLQNIDDSKGLSMIKALSSSSYSHMDDPEWLAGWEKHCGENAKPPYPEDCFFNLM